MMENIDRDKFDSEQLEYLQEFMEDYRREMAQGIINFITSVKIKGNKENHQKATQARIISRVALLDRILNKRDITAREIPNHYGISIHQYYDSLNEIEEELKDQNNNIRDIIRIKR